MIGSLAILLLGTTYYVAPWGDDANDGVNDAWRTIDRVNQHPIDDNDALLFWGGSEYEGILFVRRSIAVTSWGGNGRATVVGGIEVVNTGSINIGEIDVRSVGDRDAVHIVNTNDGDHKYSGIYLHDMDISGAAYAGIFLHGGGPETAGFRDVWIIRVDCHHNRYAGFWTGGGWHPDNTRYSHENVYAAQCRFYSNPGVAGAGSGEGVMYCQVNTGWVYECEAWDNGGECDTPNGPVGIWCIWSRNIWFGFNWSHHNRTRGGDGGGFDIDGSSSDCVMEYNWSNDNDGPGYEFCQPDNYRPFDNNIVRYNTSERDGVGFRIWHTLGSGNQVYGNVFRDEPLFDHYDGANGPAQVDFFDNDPWIGF
jgi:hypothetical protein